jgi:hypothetical protein
VIDFVYYIAVGNQIVTSGETTYPYPYDTRAVNIREAGQSPARGFRWLSGLDYYIVGGVVIITVDRQ